MYQILGSHQLIKQRFLISRNFHNSRELGKVRKPDNNMAELTTHLGKDLSFHLYNGSSSQPEME